MSFASFFTRLVDGGKDKEQRDRGRDQGRERSVERGEGQGAASSDEGGHPAYPVRAGQAAEAQQAGRRGSVGGGGQGGGQGLPMNRRSSFSKMADATEEGFGRAAAAALGPDDSSSSEEMTIAWAQPSESRCAREVSFST